MGGSPAWCNPAGSKPISGIATPDGTPAWGSAWKKAVKKSYLNTVSFDCHGANMTYRDCYVTATAWGSVSTLITTSSLIFKILRHCVHDVQSGC